MSTARGLTAFFAEDQETPSFSGLGLRQGHQVSGVLSVWRAERHGKDLEEGSQKEV